MNDQIIYISGINGYLGSNLAHYFKAKGCQVFDENLRFNAKQIKKLSDEKKKVLIHCASIPNSRKQNHKLNLRARNFCKLNNIPRILVPLTTSTLFGKRTANNSNLGWVPTHMNEYVSVKLDQENFFDNCFNLTPTFMYIPAIIGNNSQWDKILTNDKTVTTPFSLEKNRIPSIKIEKLLESIEREVLKPTKKRILVGSYLNLDGDDNRYRLKIIYEKNTLIVFLFRLLFTKFFLGSFLRKAIMHLRSRKNKESPQITIFYKYLFSEQQNLF